MNAHQILKKIDALYDKLQDIQDLCPHTNATCEYHGDTGSYDPTCDHYWATIECPDCTKRWHAESGTPDYKKYPRSI